MGTNYYAYRNVCKYCGRPENVLHIGKNSYGWQFNFKGYNDQGIDSAKDWWKILQDAIIKDEYERIISYDDFRQIVLDARKEQLNHAAECLKENRALMGPYVTAGGYWLDAEGYSFCEQDFY